MQRLLLIMSLLIVATGCNYSESLERRDAFKRQLETAQAALTRYEAEHREWSTETIAKMKKFVDDMQVAAADVAKQDGAKAVATFLEGRKTELENMTVEMRERLAKIEAKSAEVESLRNQLGEIEDKLGVKPTACDVGGYR